jgi:hypothetical protein
MPKLNAYPHPPRADCFAYNSSARARKYACIALDDLYCAKDGYCGFYADAVTRKRVALERPPSVPRCCEICGEVFPPGTPNAKKQCAACHLQTRREDKRKSAARVRAAKIAKEQNQ